MNAISVLTALRKKDIRVKFVDGSLKLKGPKGALNSEIMSLVKDNKQVLIDFFQQQSVEKQYSIFPINTVSTDVRIPLSFGQKALWFIEQLSDDSHQYNVPVIIEIQGQLDVPALTLSLQALVKRHKILRTNYHSDDQGTYQVINDDIDFELPLLDLSILDAQEKENQCQELIQEISETPFDLTSGLMIRGKLLQLTDISYQLLICMHHIASDGSSLAILTGELGMLYQAYSQAKGSFAKTDNVSATILPRQKLQYADYAAWQQDWFEKEKQRLQSFWLPTLKDLPAVHNMGTDYPRPRHQSFNGGTVDSILSEATVAGIEAIAKAHNATVFMVLQAAFATLLHRYSGESDIVMGTPVANRGRSELAAMVGLFANSLVLRNDFSAPLTFDEVLQQAKTYLLDAYNHQEMPFEVLVDHLQPDRSLSHSPLFQVLLVFQNNQGAELSLPGLSLNSFYQQNNTSKFDLSLIVRESRKDGKTDKRLYLSWEFSHDLFKKERIQHLATLFQRLIDAVIQNSAIKLDDIELLDTQESRQLLGQWSLTQGNTPVDISLHELFSRQAQRTPDQIALSLGEHQLSYQVLEEAANKLANVLLSLGPLAKESISKERLIALCLPRGINLFVTVLAILKAGCAYVPLDATLPKEVMAKRLKTIAPDLLLLDDNTEPLIDDCWPKLNLSQVDVTSGSAEKPDLPFQPSDLAYVLCTSGSTGEPKAIAMAHSPLTNLIAAMKIDCPALAETGRVLQFASIGFDMSFTDMFLAWLNGSELVLIEQEMQRDVAALSRFIRDEKISIMNLPYSMLQALSYQVVTEQQKLSDLKVVISTAEQLKITGDVRQFFTDYCDAQLLNHFGPTETHVVTSLLLSNKPQEWPEIPGIGKPLTNVSCYVLDKNFKPVPMGVVGELYCGGAGVAQGYLNNESLTAEKFIVDPFSTDGTGRLYCTGDLVRWLPQGELEFIGRKDLQIKIRGFRIELGEIESVVSSHARVQDAVVVTHKLEGETRLVAYVATHDIQDETLRQELQESVASSLPDYMVPSAFVLLHTLPLTPNGKIDRRGLPAPVWTTTKNYVAPETEKQRLLCQVWQEMLSIKQVGIEDNFFALGGNSLLISKMIHVCAEGHGVHFTVADMYSSQTVVKLAECLTKSNEKNAFTLTEHKERSVAPLSYGQYRVWYTNNIWGQSSITNIPIGIKVGGELDSGKVLATLVFLFQRHAVFNTKFTEENGQVQQQVCDDVVPVVQNHDLSNLPEQEKQEQARKLTQAHGLQLFDLTAAPLISTQIIKLQEQKYLLHFNIHHIILDGWSVMLFINEFLDSYEAIAQGRTPDVKSIPYSFRDYAIWQSNFIAGSAAKPNETFWQGYLQDCNEYLKLPFFVESQASQQHSSGLEIANVSPKTKNALVQIAKQHNGSLFNIVHSALALLIARLTGEADFNIGIPVTGRNIPGTENIMGMFLNNLPIRNKVSQEDSFSDFLKAQINNVNQVLANQEMPFERILELSGAKRTGGSTPLFQIFLNMVNLPQVEQKQRTLMLEVDEVPYVGNKFDITLYVTDSEEGIQLTCDYNSSVYHKSNIQILLEQYCSLLQQIAASVMEVCGQYDLRIAAQDKTAQGKSLNMIGEDNSLWQGPVHKCFEQRSKASPEKIALEYGQSKWTYRQLNTLSSNYAERLIEQGVKSGDVVGIMATRTDSVVVAILATLKAGAAFMMLSNDLPEKRLILQLQQVPPKCVITTEMEPFTASLQKHLSDAGCALIDVSLTPDMAWDSKTSHSSTNKPQQVNSLDSFESSEVAPDGLAYIAFTSGTSGNPKAVMGRHSSLTVFMAFMADEFSLSAEDKFCMLSGLVHDPLHRDIFTPLCLGATLLVPTDEQYNSFNIKRCLQEHNVTALHLTPSLGEMLLNGVGGAVTSLRKGFFVGEALTTGLVDKFAEVAPQMEVINLYGSTETSRAVSFFRVGRESGIETKLSNIIPVGKGIEGVQLVLLNSSQTSCSIWETGQIGIRSQHLSMGYHNDAEQTNSKFIVNPFTANKEQSKDKNDIIYLTGDLGRLLPSGDVQCLGRMDNQVKIRGFRVEPLQIQQTLETHPDVTKAAVITIKNEQEQSALVGYIVWNSKAAEAFNAKGVREFLAGSLPNYMIPQQIFKVDHIPLTENGKLDTASLKMLGDLSASFTQAIEPPASNTERELVEIWQELLNHSDICVSEDFFELGGNSLLSTRLLTRLQQKYDLSFGYREFYENSSIRAVARTIDDVRLLAKLANTRTKSNKVVL
jgi:amino acid adenylation domain-containing protein